MSMKSLNNIFYDLDYKLEHIKLFKKRYIMNIEYNIDMKLKL